MYFPHLYTLLSDIEQVLLHWHKMSSPDRHHRWDGAWLCINHWENILQDRLIFLLILNSLCISHSWSKIG